MGGDGVGTLFGIGAGGGLGVSLSVRGAAVGGWGVEFVTWAVGRRLRGTGWRVGCG